MDTKKKFEEKYLDRIVGIVVTGQMLAAGISKVIFYIMFGVQVKILCSDLSSTIVNLDGLLIIIIIAKL